MFLWIGYSVGSHVELLHFHIGVYEKPEQVVDVVESLKSKFPKFSSNSFSSFTISDSAILKEVRELIHERGNFLKTDDLTVMNPARSELTPVDFVEEEDVIEEYLLQRTTT